jgi:hypothetical protein
MLHKPAALIEDLLIDGLFVLRHLAEAIGVISEAIESVPQILEAS